MKGASPGSRTYASASLPLIAFSSPLMAATLTVDIADDTCSNIDGAPYCSIGAALSYAVNDDLILVRPGTYNEVPRFGGKAVTLVSEGGPEITVINGGGSATTVIMGPGGTLEGFKITGGKSSYGGGVAVSGYGSVIKSNIFDGNIQTAGGSGAAIHGNGASPVIEGNIFKNNSCDSQLLSGTVGFINTSSPVIRYNVFVANSCRGLNITVPSAASPIVHNNVFVQNPVGLHFDRRISTASQTYRNNIFYNNTVGIEVLFGDENYNPVFSNNIVYGNTTDYDGMDDQTGSNGNLSVDPAFVDAAARDYRQTLYSPGIDAGYNFVLSAPDFFGNPTPADGNGDETATTDIGIHEVHPPIADAGPDQEAAPLATVTLDGAGSSDQDGSIASYAWAQIAGPNVLLTDNSAASPQFSAPDKAAILTFELTVTDDLGFQSVDEVSIAVIRERNGNAGGGTTTWGGIVPLALLLLRRRN